MHSHVVNDTLGAFFLVFSPKALAGVKIANVTATHQVPSLSVGLSKELDDQVPK